MQTDSVATPPARADARRSISRILGAAQELIAVGGAGTSLEEIARRAGVGSATLHRHFPTRRVLLEAVFHSRVVELCGQASTLALELEPDAALRTWLRAVAVHGASTLGIASAFLLAADESDPKPLTSPTCEAMLLEAGGTLLHAAQQDGAVRPDVRILDLMTVIYAIALAVERRPDAATEVERLVLLAIDGISDPAHAPVRS